VAPRPRWPFEVVVIDFGLATMTDSQTGRGRRGIRVGARHIRAPEVVLGLNWGVEADLWSLGCLLATLYTGDRLFKVHEEMEHLAAMEHITGKKIPVHMGKGVSERILNKGVAFDHAGQLAWPECAKDEREVRRVDGFTPLRELVLDRHGPFLSLLQGLLEIDPDKRLTAKAAVVLPFVTDKPLGEEEGGGE
ncbi:unnamed protein product, partial [Polarella glacialis]